MQVQQDTSGRVASITDPLGAKTSFTYDGMGDLVLVKDAAGNIRSYTYDGLNRITVQTDALGNKRTSQYDAAGNLAQVVDRNGQTTTYTYDADSQLLRTAFADGDFLALTYDGFGRGTGASNSTSTITSAYDAASRLVSQTTAGPSPLGSVTTAYGYDAVGNRTSMTGPDGQTLYAYDSRSRVISLKDPSGGNFTFGYDAASRLASMTRPNGVTDNLTYNVNGQLTSDTTTLGTTTVAQLSQTYDPSAHLAGRTDVSGTTTYLHDAAGQLTGVSAPGQSPQTYAYDALGNRTAGPGSPAGTLIYDANNRLLSDATYTYSYSSEGDRTARTNKLTGAMSTYTYNSRHQLMAVLNPDGTTTTFKYDPLGRRVQVASPGQTANYVYDGANLHLEYSGAVLAASYTDRLGIDQPLEMVRGGASYYYQQDGQQSVTRLTDSTGGTAATYAYDPYGVPGPSTGSVTNPFTYTGRELDRGSGLYSYRARYYDPGTGTFLSEDPLPAVNAYSYVRNDPVDFVDPSGADLPGLAFLIAKIREFATYTRVVGCEWAFVGVTLQNALDTVVIHQPPSATAMVENLAVGCLIGYIFPGVAPGAAVGQGLRDIIGGGVFAPFIAAFLGDLAQQRSCGKTDLVHAFYVGVQAAEIAFLAKVLPGGNVPQTIAGAGLGAVSDQTPGACP
jgi:RHS repeat-associated protein